MPAGMHSTHACTHGCIAVHTHTQHTDTKRLHTQMHTHTQTLVVLSTKITCTVFNEYIPLPPTLCFFLLPLFSLTYCLHRHSSPLSSGLFSLSSPPYHPSSFTPYPPNLLSTPSSTPLLFSHTLTRFLACMTVMVTWLCVRLYFISSFTSAFPSVTTSLSRSCSSRTMRWRKV